MFPTNTTVNKIIFVLVVLIVFVYGAIRGYDILSGPQLFIDVPENGTVEVNSQLVTITGTAKNVVKFSVNGKELFLDTDGKFSHTLLLAPGVNYLNFEAQDKFGKVKKQTVTLVYKEEQKENSEEQNQ